MRIIRGEGLGYEPASHEDPARPGVLKKVLVHRDALIQGRLQMINWAMIPARASFRNHYHEDMQEVFVIMTGSVEIVVGEAIAVLDRGDAVVIEPGEPHTMRNLTDAPVEYLALGISEGKGGRTVVL